MSASFLNVAKTFAKAVDDLSLGITVVQENDDFQPPSSGQWAEMTMLSHETDSMGKSGSGDENTGVLQISLFDADAGTLQGVLLGIADQLSAEFTHGTEYTLFTDTVYINRSFRSQGRMVGGFYQIDFTIEWICYSDR
jgi:hypothetical protein